MGTEASDARAPASGRELLLEYSDAIRSSLGGTYGDPDGWSVDLISMKGRVGRERRIFRALHAASGRRFAVKANSVPADNKRQYRALRGLGRKTDDSVRAFHISTDHRFFVMEWVDAPLMIERLPGPDRQPDITRVGAWLARLHATTATHPFLAPKQHVVRLPEGDAGELAEEVAWNLRERMGTLRVRSGPTAMLHGDFHPGNLFVANERILAFDRKFHASGTIFFDIATFLVDIAHLRNRALMEGRPWHGNMETDRRCFFAGYGAIREKHLALHDLVEDLIVFRRWHHRYVQRDEYRWFEEQMRIRGLPERSGGIARPGRLVDCRGGGPRWSTEPAPLRGRS